ncbi:MAG: ABC transporter permease subunit [Verrucomicrobia bacterium]|nr:ABC transporter permease subunit [Verrucomicrobiota bacterium]NBR62936.1 ABC transporter permease subunit [Verrucomicrobiota bacterium]
MAADSTRTWGWRLPDGPTLVRWLGGGWTALVFTFLYLPIVLLVVFSFNQTKSGFHWEGFTLKWYRELFHNQVLLQAFGNSLLIGLGSTLLATVLGTLGAWMLYRYRFSIHRTLEAFIFVPMIMPEILMGVSLLVLFVILNFHLGYLTVMIAHVTFTFPFVLVGMQARLQGMDPSLEEAAMDLGATPWQAFCRVILPYLMPAIASGALLAFSLSLDDYIVTVFVTGAESQTLPLKVYGMVRVGLNPQLNALSALGIVLTMILVFASERLQQPEKGN